jgi:hypothetical protein
MGAEVSVHDPYVEHWWEFENQDNYPAPSFSKGRFFHRQDKLKRLRMAPDLWSAMKNIDALVIAVRHAPYLDLDPEKVYRAVGKPFVFVDCFCLLDDGKIKRYLELGCEVKGLGRGHIKRIKDSIRKKQP